MLSADTLAMIGAASEAAPTTITYPDPIHGLVLHVDGDYLAYYASGPDDRSAGEARKQALELIETYKLRTGSTSVVVHNTVSGSHKGERFLIATVKPYQGQRDPGRKPKNYAYLREWLLNYGRGAAFTAKNWSTREADDGIAACALFAVNQPLGPGYVAIATRDKDLRMLPGLHVNWITKDLTRVPPGGYDIVGPDVLQYGLKFFWYQMLAGDTADNIPGLEKYRGDFDKSLNDFKFKPMGPKTADKMLEDCPNNEAAYYRVTELYINAYSKFNEEGALLNPGEWADRFVEQAALLWMRCGNQAEVADFARHRGASCISQHFCTVVWDAVSRLEHRVKTARTKINQLAD